MRGKFVSKKANTNPPTGGYYFLIKNMWWIVDKNGDPIYFHGRHPQCSSIKEICEKSLKHYGDNLPKGCKVEFFENIFEPVDQSEIRGFGD